MRAMMTLLAVVGLFFLSGCAGTNYAEVKELGGYKILQGGRTGVFGADNSWVQIEKDVPPPAYRERSLIPEKVKLESTYSISVTYWENCPDKTPNRNAKNVRREESQERWTEEVPVAQAPEVMQYAPQPVFGFVGNPSVGNVTAPAAFIAGGMVGAATARRPDITHVNNGNKVVQGSLAQYQNQTMQQAQDQTAEANADAYSNSESETDTDIDIEIEE